KASSSTAADRRSSTAENDSAASPPSANRRLPRPSTNRERHQAQLVDEVARRQTLNEAALPAARTSPSERAAAAPTRRRARPLPRHELAHHGVAHRRPPALVDRSPV